MTTESLNPLTCPFCDSPAHLSEWKESKRVTENGHVCPEVWAIGCEARCFFVKQYMHHGTKEDAIVIWNRRAT